MPQTPTALPPADLDRDNPDALINRIVPVVTDAEGQLHYIAAVDPVRTAFTWEPTLLDPATDLDELTRIETFHTYGFYGFFKPSISEVLSQIPAEHLNDTVAFSTRVGGDGDPSLAIVGDYQVGETTLYRRT